MHEKDLKRHTFKLRTHEVTSETIITKQSEKNKTKVRKNINKLSSAIFLTNIYIASSI